MSGVGHRPRLVVLSQYYLPEPNFITADVAEAMAADFEVTVLAAHPNYPTGRFYPDVTRLRPTRTERGGVTVWRLPLVPYHGNSIVHRGLMYLSFSAAAAVIAPLVAGRPDIVWVYQTPLTTALAALWFRFVRRSRLVYTYADLWPESLVATKVAGEGPTVSAMYAFRRWINRKADVIIASTRGAVRRFRAEGVPVERLHYVPVWVDGVEPELPANSRAPSRTVVYAGNLGPAQRIDTLVRAAARLRHEIPDLTVDIYGAGTCERELHELATTVGATNVRFHGRVSPETAFAVSRAALAQVVSLQPTPLFAMTVPSKLYFCFAAGAPVLAGLCGEAAELAAESGGAIPFDPCDDDTLVEAVRRIVALDATERGAMSERLRTFYTSSFARAGLLERYRKIFEALWRAGAPPTAHRSRIPG